MLIDKPAQESHPGHILQYSVFTVIECPGLDSS